MQDKIVFVLCFILVVFVLWVAIHAPTNAMTLDEAIATPTPSCTPVPVLNIEEATPGLTFDTPMPTEAPTPTPTASPGSTNDHLGCGEHSCEASPNNATTPIAAPDTGHAAL